MRWSRRRTRPCSSCGAPYGCVWVDTAWVCRRCGDEWETDHDPVKYASPADAAERDSFGWTR